MNNWSVYCPTMLLHGQLNNLIPAHIPISKTLIVCSQGAVERGYLRAFLNHLGPENLCVLDKVKSNPTFEFLSSCIDLFRDKDIQQVIGVGGGSVIDVSKVLSAFISPSCDTSLYQHLIFNSSISHYPRLPLYVVPTTSGTGSEVTPFATVWDPNNQKKYSVISESLYPDKSFLDSSLLLTCSHDQLIISSLDTLSHCFESIWNKNANPFTTMLSTKALSLLFDIFSSSNPTSSDNLESFQLAGLYAGISISHTKTALAHSISYSLTLKFNIPHGLACSFTLPTIFAYMLKFEPTHFDHLSTDLGFKSSQFLLDSLCDVLTLPSIKAIFMQYLAPHRIKILSIPNHMIHPDRMKNSLHIPNHHEIVDILSASIDHIWID